MFLTFLLRGFHRGRSTTGFFSQGFRLGDGFSQNLFKLIVAVEAAAQVGKLCPQFEKLVQRLDLARNILGFKIGQLLEPQIHAQFATGGAERIVHFECKPRRLFGHHLVEVVAIDFSELAIFQLGKGFVRLGREVGHDADHKRYFPFLDGPPYLDVIGNVDPRGTNSPQLLGYTLLCSHVLTPSEVASHLAASCSLRTSTDTIWRSIIAQPCGAVHRNSAIMPLRKAWQVAENPVAGSESPVPILASY